MNDHRAVGHRGVPPVEDAHSIQRDRRPVKPTTGMVSITMAYGLPDFMQLLHFDARWERSAVTDLAAWQMLQHTEITPILAGRTRFAALFAAGILLGASRLGHD
jgi:hypothetical protein